MFKNLELFKFYPPPPQKKGQGSQVLFRYIGSLYKGHMNIIDEFYNVPGKPELKVWQTLIWIWFYTSKCINTHELSQNN